MPNAARSPSIRKSAGLEQPRIAARIPFYTIGHSTRSVDEFAALLAAAGVTQVVDVRTVPRSRTNPQYNGDTLPQSLARFDVGYRHLAALGGLRGKDRNVLPEVNGFWENASFHYYADYAMSDAFRAGFAQLCELGHRQPCAIMCAEAVWWRCHRRIIADYLLAAGEQVFHLMGPGHMEPARMTPCAQALTSGALVYPASTESRRDFS
ncbi:MAG: protein of unknown function DUF1130 [Burkholderiaceae bacterium]|jgi:uncharacterized protein (DUF488 family)|nr:MAG: protein of unknown function DUF1130 [Burkholderiaceae bacterium]